MIFSTIARGLRNIARFSGRDTLSQFWIYALSVIAVTMAAGMVALVPLFTGSLARIQKFAAEHPDQADVVTGPGTYSVTIHGNHPELMPDMSGLMPVVAATAAITVILLAAAVTRRLHDRGRRGYWAVPTLIFLMVSLAIAPEVFESFGRASGTTEVPDMGAFGLLLFSNLLYLGSLAALLIQLVQDGTRGANRFGDDPRG